MLTQVWLKNFRSIEDQNITLGPITVVYGPTGSGKSSLLYSILVLRNFIYNPNTAADALFNLPFMNLGGFDACVFNHDGTRSIGLSVAQENAGVKTGYAVSLGRTSGEIAQETPLLAMQIRVSVPYPLNQSAPFIIKNDPDYSITWNGLTCAVAPKAPTAQTQQRATEIATLLNSAPEALKHIDVVPHKRGFFKPIYSPAAVSPTPTAEDEVASLIITDQNMPARISVSLEEICGRDFRVHTPPGTATSYLKTTDKKTRIPNDLVNDGFGVNQVVYLLTKLHRPEIPTILIEEPEVHLHPSLVKSLVKHLCTLVKEDGKQVILTTHSEHVMTSLLDLVAEGALEAELLKCYLALKEKKATAFKEQKVHQSGQLEGGLVSFLEGELSDTKRHFQPK